MASVRPTSEEGVYEVEINVPVVSSLGDRSCAVIGACLSWRGRSHTDTDALGADSYAHSLRPESTYSSYGDGNASSRCNSGANCNEHTIAGR